MNWQDSRLWNLVPLGIVKWVGHRHGATVPVRLAATSPPFECTTIGGVLIRAKRERRFPEFLDKVK